MSTGILWGSQKGAQESTSCFAAWSIFLYKCYWLATFLSIYSVRSQNLFANFGIALWLNHLSLKKIQTFKFSWSTTLQSNSRKQWRIYRGGGQKGQPPPHRTFLSENLELVQKFEGGYLTIFRLLRSQKTFRTRIVKNWTFVDHKKWYNITINENLKQI